MEVNKRDWARDCQILETTEQVLSVLMSDLVNDMMWRRISGGRKRFSSEEDASSVVVDITFESVELLEVARRCEDSQKKLFIT